jgi:hypothetical protein
MRKTILAALAAASLCTSAFALDSIHARPDINEFWSGCVIARHVAPNGTTVAVDRVCSKPNATFSLFEPYQMGQRQALPGSLGATSLDHAQLRFVGFLSDFAQGDGRLAVLELGESGPARTSASFSYDVNLHVDSEAVVALPSGFSVVLRMDTSSQPTGFDASLRMPTFGR